MKKLGITGLRWLKILHLLFASLWLGGAVSLILVMVLTEPAGGDELYAVHAAMKIIDDFVIITGANGCLVTGLAYGIWTRWGFFRQNWLTVKWILVILQVALGTFFLGPWLNGNVEIARTERAAALSNPVFLKQESLNLNWGVIQVVLLLIVLWLSVKKPWKKKKKSDAPAA